MKSFDWRSLVYRLFAILNFLVVAIGALFEASSIVGVRSVALRNTSDAPYFLASFWTMVAFNFCFLGLLAVSGIYLLRLSNRGVTICNVVMPLELLYFLVVSLLWALVSEPVSTSVAGATGVANMGISVQLLTGYPLIALGCLNWVRWRRGGKVAQSDSPETQPKAPI